MTTPLGTFIRSGEVHKLPSEASELAVILEDYSNSKIDVNLESKEIPLPLIRNASISQVANRITSQLTPDKNLIQSIEALDEAPVVFPNLTAILGTQLSVRIVAAAGSLPKLARMPASTIQLLGAEKALFRHMSDGSPPPKHGLLYQHPSVKKASRKDKGRVSRKLAAKVAITAKVEYYGDKNERG